jgi:hypothetical protein
MSDARCRACGAAVPEEAQWCSLCFADLREPAPVRERVSVPAAHSAEQDAYSVDQTRAAPVAAPRPAASLLDVPPRHAAAAPDEAAAEAGPGGAAAEEATEAAEEAKWPCLRCGEQVPISLDACHSCGAGFLAGSTTSPSAHLPIVGDVGRLSRNQRVGLGFGVSIVVMIILILLATIGGHIF